MDEFFYYQTARNIYLIQKSFEKLDGDDLGGKMQHLRILSLVENFCKAYNISHPREFEKTLIWKDTGQNEITLEEMIILAKNIDGNFETNEFTTTLLESLGSIGAMKLRYENDVLIGADWLNQCNYMSLSRFISSR